MSTVIAIDGPAAAGKGTLSRKIAATYGFHPLDTGLTYRATAKALLDAGLPLDDEAVAEEVAREVDLGGLDRDVLSRHEIGEAASKIAVMSPVRKALVEAQRAFSQRSPGTVLDGRDIGTVVCPDALVKLYVTASPEVRAKRRYDEVVGRGGAGARLDVAILDRGLDQADRAAGFLVAGLHRGDLGLLDVVSNHARGNSAHEGLRRGAVDARRARA